MSLTGELSCPWFLGEAALWPGAMCCFPVAPTAHGTRSWHLSLAASPHILFWGSEMERWVGWWCLLEQESHMESHSMADESSCKLNIGLGRLSHKCTERNPPAGRIEISEDQGPWGSQRRWRGRSSPSWFPPLRSVSCLGTLVRGPAGAFQSSPFP